MSEPPETANSKPTPFAQSVAIAIGEAVVGLRASGTIEVEDGNVAALTNEIVEAVLDSSSVKKIPLRITKTLIHSEHVEEVYGTDTEISDALRPFLNSI